MIPLFWILPRPTNSVPMIDVTIESAPRISGNVVAPGTLPSTRWPSSIAAVVVTT